MLSTLCSRAALFGAALSALAIGAVADADAAPGDSSKPVAVRIAAPAPNALLDARAAAIKIVTGPDVTTIKVYDGTRDVTAQFKRDGSVWRAKLTLTPGTHKLLVESVAGKRSGDAKRVTFIAGRAAQGSATVRSGGAASTSLTQGPTGTKSYQPTPGALPVSVHTKAASIATLKLNGRKVPDVRGRRFLHDHSWLVSVRDGLRAGKNRLVMASYDQQGRHAIKRWTVVRDSQRPLAEAGPRERHVDPVKWTRLDGTETKPSTRNAKLTYRWRVVNAPKGAKPQLKNANTARPRFKPDVKGFYQVALTVTQTPRKGARVAAASTSEDVTTLGAWPPLPRQGMYVDTGFYGSQQQMTPPFNSLWFWGSAYPAFTGDPNVCLQFDEVTMGTVDYGMPKDMQPTEGRVTVCAWGATTLSGDNSVSWMPFSESNGSAIWIGTKLVAYNGSDSNWDPNTGNPTSNLHGWLKPASTDAKDNAAWVDSDMLRVQTRSKGDTPTTNTIVLGDGDAYPVTLPPGATGGYELLFLDNTGRPTGAPKLYSLTGDSIDDPAAEAHLAQDLQNAPKRTTTLLQGFGALPAVPTSTTLANVIQNMGGRADVVSRFNGKSDSTGGAYALITAPYTAPDGTVTPRANENSFERTGTGSLNALLVRDSAQSDYIPLVSDTGAPDPVSPEFGTARNQLLPLIYSAPSSWSNWIPQNGSLGPATPAQQAAFTDILSTVTSKKWVSSSQGSELCPDAPDVLRGYYCNSDATLLTVLLQEISDQLQFDADLAAKNGYTEKDFETVQQALEAEVGNATKIRAAIGNYQSIFGTSDVKAAFDAAQIGDAIKKAVTDSTQTASAETLNVISAMTGMAAAFPEISAPLTFISGSFTLMSDVLPQTASDVALPGAVQISQDSAAAELAADYLTASGDLDDSGDYLASDPVKLMQGGELLGATYVLSGDDKKSAQILGAYGAQQFLWGTMLAPVYGTWFGKSSLGTNPACYSSEYFINSPNAWGNPFSNMDPAAIWPSGIGIGDQNDTYNWYFGLNQQDDLYKNNQALPKNITDTLFGAIDPTTAPTGLPPAGAPSGTPALAPAGVVMPYWAVTYLPFHLLPFGGPTLPARTDGCWGNSAR